jgi:hypothetical protein
VDKSLDQAHAVRLYRRVLWVRLLFAVGIGAFFGGMVSLPLVLVGLTEASALGVGAGLGLVLGVIVVVASRVQRSSEAPSACGAQCSNCAAAGTQGCLAGFDRDLEGRIAAYDADRLKQLGFRMRGVLVLPILLGILDVVVLSRSAGVGPLMFALIAFVAAMLAMALMGSWSVSRSS